MKLLQILFMLFPFVGYAQMKQPIYNITDTQMIIVANGTIDPGCLNYDIEYTGYRLTDSISVGNSNYILKTAVYEEPGAGFNVIDIFKGADRLLRIKDADMWAFLYDGECTYDFRQYTDNRYFIPLDLNATTKALCFVGWPYGGDLPYLTIIVLTEKDVKTVFHKHVDISQITKVNGEYNIKIQTVLEEYDSSGVLCTAPVFGKISSKEGILYIEGFEIK